MRLIDVISVALFAALFCAMGWTEWPFIIQFLMALVACFVINASRDFFHGYWSRNNDL